MQIIESFKKYLPTVKGWINNLLRQYSSDSKRISSLGFDRLLHYFSQEILDSAKVVIINKPPMIPLSSMGLVQFKDFEGLDIVGITYFDTIFIRKDYADQESIYFHELVHVIQWNHLGIDKFLLMYGLGLLKYGYDNSPLETLAYKLQEDFEKVSQPWDIEEQIIPVLDEVIRNLFN